MSLDMKTTQKNLTRLVCQVLVCGVLVSWALRDEVLGGERGAGGTDAEGDEMLNAGLMIEILVQLIVWATPRLKNLQPPCFSDLSRGSHELDLLVESCL